MDFDGKRIVVVGGSRGLGLGMVEAFSSRAAAVTNVAPQATAVQQHREQMAL